MIKGSQVLLDLIILMRGSSYTLSYAFPRFWCQVVIVSFSLTSAFIWHFLAKFQIEKPKQEEAKFTQIDGYFIWENALASWVSNDSFKK